MSDEQTPWALPLIERHLKPSQDGQSLLLMLENAQTKLATKLSPLEASSLAHDLLEWSSATPDPEDIVVDSAPMVVEALTFEKSSRPGFVRMLVVVGASRLLFELPGEQLAAAASAMMQTGPD